MTGRILIKNGHIIDPANNINRKTNLHIAEGKIVELSDDSRDFSADFEIDADEKVVCPGLVDLRAKLREPGFEHKGTILSETRSAACSGITTLCCPPDTLPIIDTPAVARLIQENANSAGTARVVPLAAMTRGLLGAELSEMYALKQARCVGVSNLFHPLNNNLVLKRAMEYAATFDLTIHINAQDHALANKGCMHEGQVSTRLGLPGIPASAESVSVATYLALIAEVGVKAHFSLLSSANAVNLIGRARHDGLPVTADVSAHHLHLTELDLLDYDSLCHVSPPLRTQRDMEKLHQGLKQNTIDAICSDHQPHEADAKLNPFSKTEPGISGLDTLLPLALKFAENSQLTLSNIIAKLTFNPAQILGINAGTLSIGERADICIFDNEKFWVLSADNISSEGKNSPFIGWEFKGQVSHTLSAGKICFERNGADTREK